MNTCFSVLLSVYYKESPEYLMQALKSIWNDQTEKPAEIVLVKDGKLTNELENAIFEFTDSGAPLKIVQLEKNSGLGIALNEGLKCCTYDIVARMDTDDISKPDRFKKQIKVLEDNHEIDIVGSWVDEFYNDTSNVVSTRRLPETNAEIKVFAQKRNPLNHPSVMFRKKAVFAVGGYKPFLLFEDYYLWVRMIMNGSKLYNIQESLLFFRSSPDTFKRRGGKDYAKNEIALQKEYKRIGFINNSTYIKNIAIRCTTRIIPNNLRTFIYRNFLRK